MATKISGLFPFLVMLVLSSLGFTLLYIHWNEDSLFGDLVTFAICVYVLWLALRGILRETK